MLTVDVVGLRGLDGRFDRMISRGTVEIQLEEGEAGAQVLTEIYRAAAPFGEGGGEHFRDSFDAGIAEVEGGFRMELVTRQPDKRRWLKEGTGIFGPTGERIYPTHAAALSFVWHGQAVVFASIAGMKPNPWEVAARAEAEPFIRHIGSRIGHRVTRVLATGV